MSSLKPITLYAHASGPNPWKAAIILEELNLPYTIELKEFADLKKPPYSTEINPNGRVPAIVDPNVTPPLTLWESGAIITYLVETYDKEKHLISYDPTTSPFAYKYLGDQWLYFQASGQGPYFGQAAWFKMFHSEKIPSAIERYQNEIKRVVGVLEAHLKKNGTGWLVGDKATFADLAFVTWSNFAPALVGGDDSVVKVDFDTEFPNYQGWLKKLNEREGVKKAFARKAEVSEKKG